jgi:hypothetical protein
MQRSDIAASGTSSADGARCMVAPALHERSVGRQRKRQFGMLLDPG